MAFNKLTPITRASVVSHLQRTKDDEMDKLAALIVGGITHSRTWDALMHITERGYTRVWIPVRDHGIPNDWRLCHNLSKRTDVEKHIYSLVSRDDYDFSVGQCGRGFIGVSIALRIDE
jgi:hypothetical protein